MEPFIGTGDLEDALGRTLAAGSETDLAVIALDSACEIVRGYMDHDVNLVTDEVIRIDGTGTPRITLLRPPVREVAEVIEDETTLVEDTDYALEGGILRRIDQPWMKGYSNIVVTYTHGWDIEEPDDPEYTPEGFERVPSDIRRVALALAQRLFSFSMVPAGVSSQTIGNYSYTLDTDVVSRGTVGLFLAECEILDRYPR